MFDGIRKYGSLEQRVMGSFIMYDHSEDHKIQREEVVTMMRTATAVAGAQLTDAMIQQALETLMAIADTDHVCDSPFLSLSFFTPSSFHQHDHRATLWSCTRSCLLHAPTPLSPRSSTRSEDGAHHVCATDAQHLKYRPPFFLLPFVLFLFVNDNKKLCFSLFFLLCFFFHFLSDGLPLRQ